jgi:glycosyltransferase involved in cell wall biosynthesis
MRVGILSDYYPMRGGVVGHTHSLVKELERNGCEIELITFKQAGGTITDKRLYRKYFFNSPALTELVFTPYWMRVAKRILKQLKEKKCDVVHLQYEMGTFHVLSLKMIVKAKRLGIKTVVTHHEHYGNWIDRLNNHYIRDFDKIVVFTKDHRKRLLEAHIPEQKIELVHFGIRRFSVLPHPKNMRTVALMGIFLPRKGYLEAIRAFAETAQEIPQARMLIAGMPAPSKSGQEYYKEMQAEVKKNNLKDKIDFVGYVEEKDYQRFFQRTDIVLLPYDSITQSSALFDTFAFHTPVIASNIPGFSEFVENGKTGWLVDKNSIDKFGKTITAALENPGKLNKMRENIRRYAEAYSWKKVIKDYLRIYES